MKAFLISMGIVAHAKTGNKTLVTVSTPPATFHMSAAVATVVVGIAMTMTIANAPAAPALLSGASQDIGL